MVDVAGPGGGSFFLGAGEGAEALKARTVYLLRVSAGQVPTVYSVEFTSALGSGEWQFLTNYTNSSTTVRSALIQDAVVSGAAQRYYRVKSVGQLK